MRCKADGCGTEFWRSQYSRVTRCPKCQLAAEASRRRVQREMIADAVDRKISSLPEKVHGWTIISRVPRMVPRRGGQRIDRCLLVACDCGYQTEKRVSELATGKLPHGCRSCALKRIKRTGANQHTAGFEQRYAPEVAAEFKQAREALAELPWDEDARAQWFAHRNPGGAPLEVIAREYGYTRERIRQIEERALAKLRFQLGVRGIDGEDFSFELLRTMLDAQLAPAKVINRRAA